MRHLKINTIIDISIQRMKCATFSFYERYSVYVVANFYRNRSRETEIPSSKD